MEIIIFNYIQKKAWILTKKNKNIMNGGDQLFTRSSFGREIHPHWRLNFVLRVSISRQLCKSKQEERVTTRTSNKNKGQQRLTLNNVNRLIFLVWVSNVYQIHCHNYILVVKDHGGSLAIITYQCYYDEMWI